MSSSMFGVPGMVELRSDIGVQSVLVGPSVFPALITKITVEKTQVVQTLHSLDGSNYLYDFGSNPTQCTIQGIASLENIQSKRLKRLILQHELYVDTDRKNLAPITIDILGCEQIKGVIVGLSYSLDADSPDVAIFSMSIVSGIKEFT